MLLAAALVRLLSVTAAQRLPRFDDAAAIDTRVLAFALGASIASTIVFGGCRPFEWPARTGSA